ncbi:hypothetical protein K523DRAFT_149145 [Schizophyllum commune Tattone D]|nr:hypothetical protein K523DRAFT_149145 [Schizophyllum commune Tattone D]
MAGSPSDCIMRLACSSDDEGRTTRHAGQYIEAGTPRNREWSCDRFGSRRPVKVRLIEHGTSASSKAGLTYVLLLPRRK